MHFGINCVGNSTLDDKSAKRMANQNRILPVALMKFACCFGNSCDSIVTVKITRQSFSGSFPTVECQLAYNRSRRQFSPPSKIYPDDMKSTTADELRLTECR